jgi:hypothetical protein
MVSFSGSFVKTLWKNAFRSSALHLFSVCISPLSSTHPQKGPKHTVSNYRPISLTSILCKVMEQIIRDVLIDYMEENCFFTKHQHGFRKGHSCATQLIEVMEQYLFVDGGNICRFPSMW